MSWKPRYPAPISFAPELWDGDYRLFWWRWLRGGKRGALIQLGDWWQP